MKVSWWKVLGMIGMLAEELTKASADGVITLEEGINILRKICDITGVKLEVKVE